MPGTSFSAGEGGGERRNSERTETSFVKRFVFCYSMRQARSSDLAKIGGCSVRSVLGACGTHEAVGGVRRWRRSWVKMHPLPAAIQVLGRRKHRSAVPAGPSVARFAVLRVLGCAVQDSHAEVQTFMR